jgi:hypothetical protein
MRDTFFEALAAVIAVVGSIHTYASFYRERKKRRHWREAVKRLRLGESNA